MTTYTPSEASRVAVTAVARTLSMEADWISVATLPMLTIFTCAAEGAGVYKEVEKSQNILRINLEYHENKVRIFKLYCQNVINVLSEQ